MIFCETATLELKKSTKTTKKFQEFHIRQDTLHIGQTDLVEPSIATKGQFLDRLAIQTDL